MGLPRKNIFWRPCLWRMSQAMNVYSLRTSCTISPPRPHEKKEEEEKWSMIKSAIHRSLFFSPVMDQKSIFLFTPALFPIHNRLHLTMTEPHDSVSIGYNIHSDSYLTRLISLGGHFHQRKLWEIANTDKYWFWSWAWELSLYKLWAWLMIPTVNSFGLKREP